jgi:outer membrane protein assembly factor BamB
MIRRRFISLPFCLLFSTAVATAAEWPQFGGPTRDFVASGDFTPGAWDEAGPEILWRRALGEGYSGIAVASDTLYTMFRDGSREVVVAMSAANGDTIWSRAYEAPIPDYMETDRGFGPHSTPLVLGDVVYTVGVRGTLLALDRTNGEILWRKELIGELNGTPDKRGYAASPLAFEDLLILPLGGEGQSVVALRQSDGEVVWKVGDLPNAMSSARLIEHKGETQAVIVVNGAVLGVEPRTGALLWQQPHAAHWGRRNILLPLFDSEGRMFLSSQRGGSQFFQFGELGQSGPKKELWQTNQVRIHFTSPVRFGEVVYGSSGDFGPIPLSAIDLHNGEVLWRSREFARANLVRMGERALLLDEDGEVALVGLSREGLEVFARAQVLDEQAWTPPTVVGRRVFLRTRTQILALQLPSP